jgi:hypothetical protein
MARATAQPDIPAPRATVARGPRPPADPLIDAVASIVARVALQRWNERNKNAARQGGVKGTVDETNIAQLTAPGKCN